MSDWRDGGEGWWIEFLETEEEEVPKKKKKKDRSKKSKGKKEVVESEVNYSQQLENKLKWAVDEVNRSFFIPLHLHFLSWPNLKIPIVSTKCVQWLSNWLKHWKYWKNSIENLHQTEQQTFLVFSYFIIVLFCSLFNLMLSITNLF